MSKLVAPIIDEVGRGCTSDSESMAISDYREYLEEQLVRLEKNIINLSIEEATGFHDLVEKHADTGTPVLCTIQPSSLGDISVTSKPTPQSTMGWKRLAREVRNFVQGSKVGCGTGSEGEKMILGNVVWTWR